MSIPQEFVERAFPDRGVRETVLLQFAESINAADAISSSCWSVSFRQNVIRLNIGRLEMLMLRESQLDMTVDRDATDEAEWQDIRERLGIVFRGNGEPFKLIPSAYGLLLPADRIEELLPRLRPLHLACVPRAAGTVRTRPPSYRAHDPGVMAYLRQEVAEDLPDPDYGVTTPGNDKVGRRYWKISAGAGGDDWDEFREHGWIAVNWPGSPDLRTLDAESPQVLQVRLSSISADQTFSAHDAKQLWMFLHEMTPGDGVCGYGSSQVLGWGDITGGYDFAEDAHDFRHRREVTWESIEPIPTSTLPLELGDKLKQNTTIIELTEQEFDQITGEDARPDSGYWWVNQGQTYRQERVGGYLWAPKKGKGGRVNKYWTDMEKLRSGDLVVHYANSEIRAISYVRESAVDAPRPAELPTEVWEDLGYFARVEYSPLEVPIRLSEVPKEWRQPGPGPFQQDSGVKMGYLYPLPKDFVDKLFAHFADRLPGRSKDVQFVREAVERMYPDPNIRHTCLTVFADSIERAHAISPASWSVSIGGDQKDIRFNVLWTQPCVLSDGDLYVVFDREALNEAAQAHLSTAFVDGDPSTRVYPTMKFAAPYGVHAPVARLDELLPVIIDAHHGFVDIAASRVKSRAHRFQEHVPAVITYLREELGRSIPQPVYPTSKTPTDQVWLFQANPNIYNLAEELRHRVVGDDDTWVVSRFREQMRPGDSVVLWQGGPAAGIYALGELVDEPFARPTSEFFPNREQRPAEEWAVSFVYTAMVTPPLLRSELQAHPVLKELSVIRGPQGTNFKVTAEQWTALRALLADRAPEAAPRWWVEKTNVRGWASRLEGEFAVGRALVAPARSTSGADLYRHVHELIPGDIILHFTDQRAFTGWSRVAGPAEEMDTRPEFGIGPERTLVVPLEGYHSLDPPLSRETLFAPPYAERLRRLLEQGHTDTFYSMELELRLKGQAYLTPASPELVAILKDAYHAETGLDLGPAEVAIQDGGSVAAPDPVIPYEAPAFDAILEAVRAQGIRIDPRTLRRYHLALRTRGFVVLSGLSGTGKTWLAEAYARAVGAQHAVVAVAPNWTTNEDLLGYLNPLTEQYHHTAFSRFVREAGKAYRAAERVGVAPQPYHLVLDEMNLARVEYYFAQFLSAMEVRARHGAATIDLGTDELLQLPPNLVVIGTVNVDETTHGFADKVHDRAQLIELDARREDLVAHLDGTQHQVEVMAVWDAVRHVGPFTFRVLDEIRAYVDAAVAMGTPWEEALDEQLLQKVLPKLKGADPRVGDALSRVIAVTEDRFPLCHAKAATMLEGFRSHGFASYFG